MKKIFFALAAVAALAACSKSDAQYDDIRNEISLAPVAQNITKAMVAENTFPNEDFNVWAWYKQLDPGTSISEWQQDETANQWYIAEKTFEKKSGNNDWSGKTAYYWPKLGSLLFAGYYPASLAGNVSYTFDGTTNKMIFSGIYQSSVNNSSANHEEDIMYFPMTEKSVSAGPVAVVFKHALSWITINVKKSTENPKIVIDEIKFTQVNNFGTGTVDNSGNKTIVWQVSDKDENKNAETIFGSNVTLKTESTKLVEPLFIPQEIKGDIVIKYTIYSSDTEFFTETYTSHLADFKVRDNAIDKWAPAKHYTYNIAIGTSEILIKPEVVTWDEVPVPVAVEDFNTPEQEEETEKGENI